MKSTIINIAQKQVGAGHPPFMIAEMSGNHNGSLDRALEIVRQAAKAGADAIKLQTYTPATLTVDSRRPEFFIDDPESPWHGRRLWELYEEAHTPWDWHGPIFDLARSLGLACVSTVFDESSLRFLTDCGVDAIKIASFELIHIPLLEKVACIGKPILLSTGMASLAEIDDAVAALRRHSAEFILLKCTSAYPSEEKEANLLTMQDMRARYGCEVGLSDHVLRPYTAYAAVALGASVIEKHFILNRSEGGVDAAFSLEPVEFKELVDGARRVFQSRGELCYGPRCVEETSLKERPSIYVVRAMRKGDIFTPENTRVIRPGNGLAPKNYPAILGKRAGQDINAEIPMSWDLLQEGQQS